MDDIMAEVFAPGRDIVEEVKRRAVSQARVGA